MPGTWSRRTTTPCSSVQPLLVRNLTVSGKRKIRGRQITVSPERIVLADTLAGLHLTREQLIEIGILVGTDFNPGG